MVVAANSSAVRAIFANLSGWDAVRPLYARVLAGQLTPEEASRRMQADALAKIAEMSE